MAPQQLRATATHLLRILGPGNASRLLLNGAPAVATALGVGLHLTSAQLLATAPAPATPTASMPIAAVPTSPAPGGSGRRRGRLLGASCHSVAELLHAQAIGADYAVLGPVAATRSHPDARPIGWDRFRQWRESVTLPVFALGGLSMQDFAMARAHGAQGIAAIRSFWLPQRARPD